MKGAVSFFVVCVLASVVCYFATDYFLSYRDTQIASYYSEIENQEVLRSDVMVSPEEFSTIQKCSTKGSKSTVETCMRDFYDGYTMKVGPEKAFAHLARLESEHPKMLPGCHYISHGIGHASLRLNDNIVSKTFTVMQNGNFIKNVATCGNGYFHGVIEEAAKHITDNDELARLMRSVCESASGSTSCHHGAGHAILIQKEYNMKDTLGICEKISDKPDEQFECYTGAFMEYGQEMDIAEVKDGKLKLVFCDAQQKKYQPACYMEQSSVFENYSTEPRNYTRNMGFCKQFDDPLNRMACVKLFAIRSVRIAHYKDVYSMCMNTSTTQERIMCTAVAASKIARSRDKTSGDEYRDIIHSVCTTLNPLYASYCMNLAYVERTRLFYTSEADLGFSTLKGLLLGWMGYYTSSNGSKKY